MSVVYFLRCSYFSGGMSGTILSDFMKSMASAEFHLDCYYWIHCSVIVGFQVVNYVYLEGMPVQVFSRYSIERLLANIRDVVSSS